MLCCPEYEGGIEFCNTLGCQNNKLLKQNDQKDFKKKEKEEVGIWPAVQVIPKK